MTTDKSLSLTSVYPFHASTRWMAGSCTSFGHLPSHLKPSLHRRAWSSLWCPPSTLPPTPSAQMCALPVQGGPPPLFSAWPLQFSGALTLYSIWSMPRTRSYTSIDRTSLSASPYGQSSRHFSQQSFARELRPFFFIDNINWVWKLSS